ncbi:reverse transcriptase N-terminal domain-containing protein [Bacillus sp. JAS24-2]|uniref:reverse transcriptase N-terminal domain-containing protein n=1 Tax=Bacillus sp. JAS24-2 TaxID=2217832 RepID=UPI0015D1BB38|nr:reverse transcriptase N-terminal domain-containing protein [Bacillus sp. JAS24-2]
MEKANASKVKIHKYVEKLRQRTFHAEQLGQHRKLRKCQHLMLISKANLLLSIRRVTQVNKDKRTAKIDGYKALISREIIDLYNRIEDYNIHSIRPKLAKRIYVLR